MTMTVAIFTINTYCDLPLGLIQIFLSLSVQLKIDFIQILSVFSILSVKALGEGHIAYTQGHSLVPHMLVIHTCCLLCHCSDLLYLLPAVLNSLIEYVLAARCTDFVSQ